MRRGGLTSLEAAGRSQVGRNCVASPASLCFCRSTALRQRALRPQLKRDPLVLGAASVFLLAVALAAALAPALRAMRIDPTIAMRAD